MERKACLEILILSLALTVGGAGSSTAQDSKPTGRKPTGKEPTKTKKYILLNRRTANGGCEVYKVDLATDKSTPFFAVEGDGATQYMLISISPNAKTGLVHVRGGANAGTALYDLDTGKVIESKIPKERAYFCFLNDEQLIYAEKLAGGKDGDPNMRIVQCDLKGSKRNVLFQTEEKLWDDVPLSLTPDKQFVIYYARHKDNSRKGLSMVSLKDGSAKNMPEGLAFSCWSPDGKKLFAYSQKKKGFFRYDHDGKGNFSNEKKLGEFVAFLRTYGQGKYLGIRSKNREEKPRLVIMGADTTVKHELTTKLSRNEAMMFQPSAYDSETESYYFIESERQGDMELTRLIEATIKDGQVKRRVVIVSDKELSMPFLLKQAAAPQKTKPADTKAPKPKKPAPKQPAAKPGQGKKPAALLLSIRTKEGSRLVQKLDLATHKFTNFLGDAAKKMEYTLFRLSPNKKIGLVMVSGEGVKHHSALFNMQTGKAIDSKLSKNMEYCCFIDNDKIVTIEDGGGREAGEVKTRIVLTDVKGKTRKVLHESDAVHWDDVPLALTPDKKQVLYYDTSEDRGAGIRMVSLADGSVTDLPKGLTVACWAPDGKTFFGFNKPKLSLMSFDFKKGKFSNEKTVAARAVFFKNVGPNKYLGLKFSPDFKKVRLAVMDKDAKLQLELTDKASSGDASAYQPAAYDAATKTYYFVETEREQRTRLNRLVAVTIKDGKVAKRRVLKASRDERMALPFLVEK